MIYDVEADFMLLNTCNFRCKYCFEFFKDARAERVKVYATPGGWAKAFDDTGLTWLLHLTGGEPSLYPGFADLCMELTRNHYISINSNLSGDVVDFIMKVPRDRVHYINAALHYFERKKKGRLADFETKVNMLSGSGFIVLV